MSTRLACPVRHRETDAEATRSDIEDYAASTSWEHVHRRLLETGHCPACPARTLADEAVTLYTRECLAGRCDCCGALWLLDADGYTVLDAGRLGDELTVLGAARRDSLARARGDSDALRAAVGRARSDGGSEAEMARRSGVDRMTIRKWLGKR